MTPKQKNPRVLIVTPEVTYLPDRMGNLANFLTAKAGGLADVSAALISALFNQGADVHVALPDYRAIFKDRLAPYLKKEQRTLRQVMPDDRIHLAEDRNFFYLNRVYSNYGGENARIALAFQREVINNIVPRVRPDLIHCNDWMTGLIPAMARQMGSPACSRFTTSIPSRPAAGRYRGPRHRCRLFLAPASTYEDGQPLRSRRETTRWISCCQRHLCRAFRQYREPHFPAGDRPGRHSFVEDTHAASS
jgi:hypothetical protein